MAGQVGELVQYNFRSGVYNFNENVKVAVIAGFDLSIPAAYKRVTEGGSEHKRIEQPTTQGR
jgi:hypothetical protein